MLTLRSFFFVIGSLITLAATAQENFQNGYIVLPQKDTIRGQVDYREWVSNPQRITFLDPQTGKKTSYGTREITAFFVSAETYRSYSIHVSPYINGDLSIGDESNFPSAYDTTAFLRLVTGGQLNLYAFRDHTDISYFFVQRSGALPEQLEIKTAEVTNNGMTSVERKDLYKYRLASLVADCPAMRKGMIDVDYAEKALRKLIFAYNNCGKDTVERRTAGENHTKSVFFTPLIGYVHSTVRVSSQQLYEGQMSWPAYNSLAGGVGMLVVLPRGRQQYSFLLDALYHHFQSQGNTVHEGNGFTVQSGFAFDQAQLDVQFRYRYPAGRVRPFANIGFGEVAIFSNKSVRNNNETGSQPIFGDASYMRHLQSGFIGGAGVQAGRFTLEARVEKTDDLTTIIGTGAALTHFFLLAGFNF